VASPYNPTTTLLKGLNDPTARPFDAVQRYTDGLHVAAEQRVGSRSLGCSIAWPTRSYRGLTSEPSWPTLILARAPARRSTALATTPRDPAAFGARRRLLAAAVAHPWRVVGRIIWAPLYAPDQLGGARDPRNGSSAAAPRWPEPDGSNGPRIVRKVETDVLNDSASRCGIWRRVGRLPILAAGSSNGDLSMLQLAEQPSRPGRAAVGAALRRPRVGLHRRRPSHPTDRQQRLDGGQHQARLGRDVLISRRSRAPCESSIGTAKDDHCSSSRGQQARGRQLSICGLISASDRQLGWTGLGSAGKDWPLRELR